MSPKWTQADMRKVRDAIAKEAPEAVFHENDYGWGLSVHVPATHRGVTLFEIGYRVGEDGEPVPSGWVGTDMADVPSIVAHLKRPDASP